MESAVLNYIIENRDWIFSGVGLFVITVTIRFFSKRKDANNNGDKNEIQISGKGLSGTYYGYYRSPRNPKELSRMIFKTTVDQSGDEIITVDYVDNGKDEVGSVKKTPVKAEVYFEIKCADGHYDHMDYMTVMNIDMAGVYIGTYCSISELNKKPCCGIQVITKRMYDRKSKEIFDLIDCYEKEFIINSTYEPKEKDAEYQVA